MDDQEQAMARHVPLTARLVRLELMTQLLIERHCSSKEMAFTVVGNLEGEDECKSISAALEEVRQKGSIADRVRKLERRLIQVSFELEERNNTNNKGGNRHVFGTSNVEGKIEDIEQHSQFKTNVKVKRSDRSHRSRFFLCS